MLNTILPLGTTATILIAIGVVLIASEFSSSAHGLAATLGLAAIIGGTAVLCLPEAADVLSAPFILVAGLAAVLAAALVTMMGLSARRKEIRTGAEALLGMTGPVLSWEGSSGHILVHGERWQAEGAALAAGNLATVVAIEGLILEVQPAGGNGRAQ